MASAAHPTQRCTALMGLPKRCQIVRDYLKKIHNFVYLSFIIIKTSHCFSRVELDSDKDNDESVNYRKNASALCSILCSAIKQFE